MRYCSRSMSHGGLSTFDEPIRHASDFSDSKQLTVESPRRNDHIWDRSGVIAKEP